MFDWGNLVVIGVVAAAAVWCIRWVYGIWKGKAALCACDPEACPAARKLERLSKMAAEQREDGGEPTAPEDGR